MTTDLSPGQLEKYNLEGFVLLDPIFNLDELEEMRAESDRLIEFTIDASLALKELNPRLDLQRRDGKIILRKIQPVSDTSEVFARFSNDERLLRPLADVLGAQPILMEEKLNYKQVLPGPLEIETSDEGESFPYHTDIAYYALDGYPRETVSSALFIDDTTPENGPLRVLPRSHLKDWPIQDDWPPLVKPEAVPEDQVIDVLAPAGSVLIFHSALVHSSSENRTDSPRRLMIYSHYPSTFDIEADKRNRVLRERSEEHERRYRELMASGPYKPEFTLS